MWACHSSRAFVSLLRRTIFSFSCITKFSSFICIIFSLFCQALFSLFCPAIISFSCVPVQESATDRGKRVVGSKTTYFVLSYKLHFFLREARGNRFEYLANTFNLHNVVISEKYPRLARVLAARYQQSKRYSYNRTFFTTILLWDLPCLPKGTTWFYLILLKISNHMPEFFDFIRDYPSWIILYG